METKDKKMDWSRIREKLNGSGPTYWKGLEELAETDEFKSWVEDEFPHRRSLLDVDRRGFLKVMGASMALAGLAGCRKLPQAKIVPQVKMPEDRTVGIPEQYASSFSFAGHAFPLLITSKEGRPTKLDGGMVPGYSGASDVFVQGELLSMYDPERLGTPLRDGLITSWDDFYAEFRPLFQKEKVGILMESTSSPTLRAQVDAAKKANPNLKVFEYDIVNSDSEQQALMALFGMNCVPVYDFGANTIVSLDADLYTGSHASQAIAQMAARRAPEAEAGMSRIYAFESSPTLTGVNADHRWALKPSEVEGAASALAAAMGLNAGGAAAPSGVSASAIQAIAEDLRAGGIVVAGAHQTPFVHAVAHMINASLGRVSYRPISYVPKQDSLKAFMAAVASGAVEHVLLLGGNPVYGAPGDLKVVDALVRAKTAAYVGGSWNETAKICRWVLPESHFLEAWGDGVTPDGLTLLQQPIIEPLRDSKSAAEVLSALMGKLKSGEQLVKDQHGLKSAAWRQALNDGFYGTKRGGVKAVVKGAAPAPSAAKGEIEAVFLPDPTLWDGRYANNSWLQETPKPLTKLTWDNAVIMGPNMAKSLGVGDQNLVTLTMADRTVTAPVYIQPGHADGAVTLHFGGGRSEGGKVSEGCGFNFAPLRPSSSSGFCPVTIAKAAGSYDLASTQLHHSMEGRECIREGSLADWQKNPGLVAEEEHGEGLYNLTKEWAEASPELPQWGMTVDLSRCVGCNACVSACQAENNISTVGKIEVQRHRNLHWIRIDRYYRVHDSGGERDIETGAGASMNMEALVHSELSGPMKDEKAMDPNTVSTVFQPVACVHCEVAPCEPVCPVAATIHSHEGLNQMVYNRCVGTRYCSNNCPYKVRRFNYYNYQHGQTDAGLNKPYGQRNFIGEEDKPTLRLLNNPDVTVRSRGVMEKCTYCVQRINHARISAKKDGRDLQDGDVVTACQQACPAGAIVFGNIADAKSRVSQSKKLERNYGLLAELGTVPRTTYLGKVRNPNPKLEKA